MQPNGDVHTVDRACPELTDTWVYHAVGGKRRTLKNMNGALVEVDPEPTKKKGKRRRAVQEKKTPKKEGSRVFTFTKHRAPLPTVSDTFRGLAITREVRWKPPSSLHPAVWARHGFSVHDVCQTFADVRAAGVGASYMLEQLAVIERIPLTKQAVLPSYSAPDRFVYGAGRTVCVHLSTHFLAKLAPGESGETIVCRSTKKSKHKPKRDPLSSLVSMHGHIPSLPTHPCALWRQYANWRLYDTAPTHATIPTNKEAAASGGGGGPRSAVVADATDGCELDDETLAMRAFTLQSRCPAPIPWRDILVVPVTVENDTHLLMTRVMLASEHTAIYGPPACLALHPRRVWIASLLYTMLDESFYFVSDGSRTAQSSLVLLR